MLEALLLVVDTPVTVEQLAAATEQPAYRVAAKLQLMAEELTARDSGIDLREAGGGWRMYTRARFAPYVERLLLDGARSKLTRAALETLAVVAYRQPVTRARVSAVRGVNVDAVMRTLLARGLITEAGTDPDTGAVTFATTELFLERLGLTSLADLPDIAPLLPDVDVIDDLSESLGDEPRFMKLSGAPRGRGADVVRRGPGVEMADSEGVRLQKVLSQAGIASRRVAEKMIIDGRVEVDDRVVTELGTRVDPEVSVIRVDGARVTVDDTLVHLAINKPQGHALDDVRRSGPAVRRRPGRASGSGQQEAVSRRAARRRHRRADAADQRRRAGAPVDASVVRGAQDVPGDGARRGAARAGPQAARRDRTGRRPGACRRFRGGGHGARQDAGAGDAARGPQADRAPAAGGGRVIRCRSWCAPTSARCRWAISGRAASGC